MVTYSGQSKTSLYFCNKLRRCQKLILFWFSFLQSIHSINFITNSITLDWFNATYPQCLHPVHLDDGLLKSAKSSEQGYMCLENSSEGTKTGEPRKWQIQLPCLSLIRQPVYVNWSSHVIRKFIKRNVKNRKTGKPCYIEKQERGKGKGEQKSGN